MVNNVQVQWLSLQVFFLEHILPEKHDEFHSINFISNLAFLIRGTELEGNCCIIRWEIKPDEHSNCSD